MDRMDIRTSEPVGGSKPPNSARNVLGFRATQMTVETMLPRQGPMHGMQSAATCRVALGFISEA